MASCYVKGKALLVITKTSEKRDRYDTWPFIQHYSGAWQDRDSAQEDLCIVGSGHPLPISGKRMKLGETVRVAVTFEIHYHSDYWGEWDSKLTYSKVKVLRRQKPKVRYISKKDRSF